MSEKRIILEMGTGNDLYGQDYTKAARRAVQDALHHSSITLFSKLGVNHSEMRVEVTIGVQQPDAVDCELVAQDLPRGRARVRAVKGGLDVDDAVEGSRHVVATAAVEAWLPDQAGKYKIRTPE
ncbi:Lin0512 family protein [Leisingera aquaemixtae]|uniref:Lin0512 family protein n=1 Tax=Leisingera aquaemixtae TaxID=1396826 RepID=A0ABY5WIQ0_9RHOB|nr:Lin0512 family protein [Leisingera aquaemixtae]UWQ41343.1 Lin0512 family protein [Leisingera aquaemixtae]